MIISNQNNSNNNLYNGISTIQCHHNTIIPNGEKIDLSGVLGKNENRKRPGTFNNILKNSSNVHSSIIRESSIGRTAKQNINESLNNVSINGKRVKK